MAIITLTTDMGLKDHYVAVVKGAILRQLPGAVIVDVSHSIRPFDNAQAAFVLRNTYPEFPRVRSISSASTRRPTAKRRIWW